MLGERASLPCGRIWGISLRIHSAHHDVCDRFSAAALTTKTHQDPCTPVHAHIRPLHESIRPCKHACQQQLVCTLHPHQASLLTWTMRTYDFMHHAVKRRTHDRYAADFVQHHHLLSISAMLERCQTCCLEAQPRGISRTRAMQRTSCCLWARSSLSLA